MGRVIIKLIIKVIVRKVFLRELSIGVCGFRVVGRSGLEGSFGLVIIECAMLGSRSCFFGFYVLFCK